jgi:ABC-2 type transport system permease protein
MWERLRNMLIKEFLQVLRDPKMRGVIFVMPLLQVMVFGYAVTTDVRNVPVAVLDFDQSVASRELLSRFSASGYFRFVSQTRNVNDATHLLDKESVGAILRIDQGFEEDLRAGRTAKLQVIADGTDSNTAGIVLGYTGRIAGEFSGKVLLTRFSRLRGEGPLPGNVELISRAWFNENLESRNFYVPGVIAIIVMLVTLMLTSMAIVREKEIGTMEQLMVTLFISTVSRTQQQAMLSVFFFYFPSVLLSGFMFPIANMPSPVQYLTYANPLRYFLVILRGIFLKGAGTDTLWPPMAALLAMGLLTLLVTTRRFRKTLA